MQQALAYVSRGVHYACKCAELRLANGCSYAKQLVWPATTVFLSKRLLLLAQGAWWDRRSKPDYQTASCEIAQELLYRAPPVLVPIAIFNFKLWLILSWTMT